MAIGEIARRVYRKHYRRPRRPGARDLWLLGKILDAGADAMHGELLSYLFFAGEFAEELIQLDQADAQRWIDEHPAGLWQLDPLPAWSQAPTATQARSAPREQAPMPGRCRLGRSFMQQAIIAGCLPRSAGHRGTGAQGSRSDQARSHSCL